MHLNRVRNFIGYRLFLYTNNRSRNNRCSYSNTLEKNFLQREFRRVYQRSNENKGKLNVDSFTILVSTSLILILSKEVLTIYFFTLHIAGKWQQEIIQ